MQSSYYRFYSQRDYRFVLFLAIAIAYVLLSNFIHINDFAITLW